MDRFLFLYTFKLMTACVYLVTETFHFQTFVNIFQEKVAWGIIAQRRGTIQDPCRKLLVDNADFISTKGLQNRNTIVSCRQDYKTLLRHIIIMQFVALTWLKI